MFSFFKHYKPIQNEAIKVGSKIKSATDEQKSLINKIIIIGVILLLLIGAIQIAFAILHKEDAPIVPNNPVEQQIQPTLTPSNTGVENVPKEAIGETGLFDIFNPFSSFQQSVVDSISEIVMQGLELFDDYVGFTPNIAKNDGQIVDARGKNITIHVDKFYNATQSVAWLLLPLVIVITGTYLVLEGSVKGMYLLQEVAKKTLLFVIGMVAMRFLFATAIDLTNGLDRFVLNKLVATSQSGTLSESLLTALGLQIINNKLEFSIASTMNLFSEIILWIGLFFLLVTLLFQFIIRFFHVLLHIIMFPIVFIIGLLPSGEQFFKAYIEETLRALFMQPIFLIGIGIALEIITSVNEPVPKVILGLGSLAFLNLIPAIVNRFSGILWGVGGGIAGGIVAGATINQARKAKEGIVAGMSGGKSSSVRMWASKALGESIMSKLPMGNTVGKVAQTGSSIQGSISKAKSLAGSFKSSVMAGEGSKKSFATLGMKPLDNRALKDSGTQTLYSLSPSTDKIQDLSVKDGTLLANGLKQSTYSSAFGSSALVEEPASINQMMDLSKISFSNPNTTQYVSEAVQASPVEINQGKTFDTSNPKHWGHITDWYTKNEMLTGAKPSVVEKYVQNPENQMGILSRANSEGYFQSQGIQTVKIIDQVQGQKPVTKYYPIKHNLSQSTNAGNRSSKTK